MTSMAEFSWSPVASHPSADLPTLRDSQSHLNTVAGRGEA